MSCKRFVLTAVPVAVLLDCVSVVESQRLTLFLPAVSPSLPTPTHPPPPTYSRLPRGAIVEEAITAGDGGSGVYWRVLNP